MFFFAAARCVSLGPLFDHKKGRAFRGFGQQRDKISCAAGGDELFGAGDLVADDFSGIVDDRCGLGLDVGDIAAGARFGHGVGHQRLSFGNGAEPFFLLFNGPADHQGVGAQLNRKKGRGDSEANFGHLAGEDVTVLCTTTHAAVFFRNHQQLKTDLRAQHFPDRLFRKNFFLVPFENLVLGEQPLAQLSDRVQHHLAHFRLEAIACLIRSGSGFRHDGVLWQCDYSSVSTTLRPL